MRKRMTRPGEGTGWDMQGADSPSPWHRRPEREPSRQQERLLCTALPGVLSNTGGDFSPTACPGSDSKAQ